MFPHLNLNRQEDALRVHVVVAASSSKKRSRQGPPRYQAIVSLTFCSVPLLVLKRTIQSEKSRVKKLPKKFLWVCSRATSSPRPQGSRFFQRMTKGTPPVADQKDRGLWERDWYARYSVYCAYVTVPPLAMVPGNVPGNVSPGVLCSLFKDPLFSLQSQSNAGDKI